MSGAEVAFKAASLSSTTSSESVCPSVAPVSLSGHMTGVAARQLCYLTPSVQ